MTPGQYFRGSDLSAARILIDRIGKLNEHRLAMDDAGHARQAAAAADNIHGLLDTCTAQELRAAVIQLTTPELRPAVPVVVVGPGGAPVKPTNPPALVQRVMDLVKVYGDARADWARRAVSSDVVQRALDAVEDAVEPLAIGALIDEVDGAWRDGRLS